MAENVQEKPRKHRYYKRALFGWIELGREAYEHEVKAAVFQTAYGKGGTFVYVKVDEARLLEERKKPYLIGTIQIKEVEEGRYMAHVYVRDANDENSEWRERFLLSMNASGVHWLEEILDWAEVHEVTISSAEIDQWRKRVKFH